MKKLALLLLSAILATACAQAEIKPAEPIAAEPIAAEPTVAEQPSTGKIIIPKDPNETYGYKEEDVKNSTQLDASYTDGYDLEKKWILTYGFPPTPDPVAVKYESYGVELIGWIIDIDPYEMGDPRPVFHLGDDSITKLPFKMKFQDFHLNYTDHSGKDISLTDEMMAKLRISSPSSPITITVDKLTMHMEGFHTLRLASPPL